MHHERGRYAARSPATHTMPRRASFGSHAPAAFPKRCVVAQRPAPRQHRHQLHILAARGSTASTYRGQHVGHHGTPMDGCPGGAMLECRRQRAHRAQAERQSAPPPTLPRAGRVECLLRANGVKADGGAQRPTTATKVECNTPPLCAVHTTLRFAIAVPHCRRLVTSDSGLLLFSREQTTSYLARPSVAATHLF